MSFLILDGAGYDSGAKAYFNFLSEDPSTARKKILNTLVKNLKASGNWGLLDRLWLYASEKQQAGTISLVNPSSTALTEVNAPTWVANQGYTSDGATSYIDTNFNPNTQGINYVLNSCCVFVYNRTNIKEDNNHGNYDATNAVLFAERVTSPDETATARINQTVGAVTVSASNTNSSGLILFRRTASNAVAIFRNGSSLGTGTTASNGFPNNNMYFLARNANGTPNSFSTKQHSIFGIGSGAIDQAALYTHIQQYMTSLGTQV